MRRKRGESGDSLQLTCPGIDRHGMCKCGMLWEEAMLLGIGLILLVAWALGLFAFHVVGGLIHLLLILAVISFVIHLVRRRT